MDGKSLKGRFYGDCEAFQNFVGVVSLYSQKQRLVLAQQGYENKKKSEIHVVWELLDQLELKDVVVSLDALLGVTPAIKGSFVEPKRYVSTLLQTSVILGPVADLVTHRSLVFGGTQTLDLYPVRDSSFMQQRPPEALKLANSYLL